MLSTVTDRVADVATTLLPVGQARNLLLPPVRLARAGAVKVATTVRHWEVTLEGGSREEAPTVVEVREPAVERTAASSGGLAIDDWAQLSYADAQARITALHADELEALLDYERSHGHRMQYTLLLENRLGGRDGASEPQLGSIP